MKPVQHEHEVEVKLSKDLEDQVLDIRDNLNEIRSSLGDHGRAYLVGGIVGIVAGAVGARLFIRPVINVTVVPNID